MLTRVPYRRLKSLYSQSPQWVKRVYSSIPFSWRSGRCYRETRRLIDSTDQLSADELQYEQHLKLHQLLHHAAANVPHYRDSFRQAGFEVSRDPADLAHTFHLAPLVDKRQIQQSSDRFRAVDGVKEAAYADNTGGSSGTPFEFIKNNSMYPIEQAYMMAQWARVGYQPGDRKLTLRGRSFSGMNANQRWAINPIYNELAVSTYHLDAETVASSFPVVKQFRPRFLHGYPAAIVRYLRVLSDANLSFPEPIQAVFCGSEPTYDYQRSFINETLGCRVYSWYGQSECVILAGECEVSQEYHSFPLYGVMELVDDNGGPITSPGVEGEIVGTSLNNWAMPFIRYRTGDRGVYSEKQTCGCGRSYPRLKHVTGRIQHFVYSSGRRPIPVTAFVFGQHFDAFSRIRAMQLVQEEPGQLMICVVRGPGYSESDERELRTKMQSSVDDELTITFRYVEQLESNPAGKVDFVVQHVKEREC